MIISHRHKFIFIKTRKTAGTSLEIALSKFLCNKDISTPIIPEDEKIRYELYGAKPSNYIIKPHYYRVKDLSRIASQKQVLKFKNHDSAKFIKDHIKESQWKEYYKFAFDRNPWDKTVSMFYYLGGYDKYKSFEEFIENYDLNKLSTFNQVQINGKISVDKIYKFEELDKGVDNLSRNLFDNQDIEIKNIKSKSNFRKQKRKDYHEIHTKKTKSIIETFFAREINLFNYIF